MSLQIRGRTYPYKAWVKNLPYVVMTYNCSPNRITGFSPYEIMFGRPPAFPLANPDSGYTAPTVENLSDRALHVLSALRQAREHISDRLDVRRQQIKAMFDKFRQPLRIRVGDYAYVYYPPNRLLRKMHPKAFGPYPVVRVSFLPGTRDPVGVTLNFGTEEEPDLRRFPRARVHPFSFTIRDIDWAGFSDRADECREGSQEFLQDYAGAIDLSGITNSSHRRMDRKGVLTDLDLQGHTAKLTRYLEDNQAGVLSRPVIQHSEGEIPLATRRWRPDIWGHPYLQQTQYNSDN